MGLYRNQSNTNNCLFKMAYHDFEKLSSVPIAEVCNKLDIQIVRGKQALCFMHDDHKPSMAIYNDTNSWYCFTCGKGGGVIDLVAQYLKKDRDEACNWLEVEFNMKPKPFYWKWEKRAKPISTTKQEETRITVESELLEWVIDHTTLTEKALRFLDSERKIKSEIYQRLNIRALDDADVLIRKLLQTFGKERLITNHLVTEGRYGYYLTWDCPCLLFPYYDETRKLVNIQSRYLEEITGDYPQRFRFIKDSKTYLFNAQLLPQLKRQTPLLVTEGVTDCLAALSAGVNAVAVPGASAFKQRYVDLLKDFTLFICPDKDKPGYKLLSDMKNKMSQRCCEVRELCLDDGSKDIGEYYAKHERLGFGKRYSKH